MARIFRQTYTKQLPTEAEIFTKKGKKYARFKNGKGKTITAPLSQDDKNVIRETSKWYIEYRDADGMIKRVAGYTDRKATEQYASELERDAERVRSGYKPKEHKQLSRPLVEHIKDFEKSLLAKGRTSKHAKQTALRVEKLKRAFRNRPYKYAVFWVVGSQFPNIGREAGNGLPVFSD